MENLQRQTIGRYKIGEEIGRGIAGIVCAARDTEDGKPVALKVAHVKPGDDEQTRRRRYNTFMTEARTGGMLKHENIIEIYGVGDKGGVTYIAMELIKDRRSLDQHCQPENLLAIKAVVSIMIKCATALDFAHRNGVVHRDVKPKNLFLTDNNEPKIGDFSIALVSGYDAADTQDEAIVGSPLYMSPEQVTGECVSAQSDIFALGVVLYELLTGQHPFHALLIPAISTTITHKAHIPVNQLRPQVPATLAKVVDRALKKHPAGRYQTGLDIAGDLGLVFDDIQFQNEDLSSREHFDRLRGLRCFANFPEPAIWEILNSSHRLEFPAESQLIEEGEPGQSIFILVEGEVEVKKGTVLVDTLKAGASFAETGLTTRKNRMASVFAHTRVTVLEIRTGLIQRFTPQCQLCLYQSLIDTMAERLFHAMEKRQTTVG